MKGSALLERKTAESSADSRDRLDECRLSRDELFNLLRNPRRRAALQYLLERDRKATRSELAEHIAAAENEVTTAELNSAQRKRVYVSLYQNHLPKMDEYGVITYDAREGTAELTSEARVLAHYLDADVGESESNRWERYYPLFGLLGGVSLVITSLDRLFALPLDFVTAVSVLLLLIVPVVAIDREFL
ncbi:DUF7344 domain-containing protein [Halogeometricum luteum]|uniref:DUF7344 domain-containing protein n=1 Tax=Halogeometricum luteum TaxID=2950537 RepID=A0ABU2G4L6_9EURY|nr:hypothetical protein [Halogeometricum sp. S3BR5-2]MDS0295228.1 hypothetical protein [Halogeometricum sp. S3BR5-2]